jgi:2-oxoglutarate ferredoxin oxidoreductase subunit beta
VAGREDFGKFETAWCPGCGNFMLLDGLKSALADSGLAPHQVLIVSGIGQAAKAPQYLRCNMFNGLHGRSLPVATAAKFANRELTVIAESGDGCMYAEGGNHLTHAIRRNVDITCLVHDNQVYGLTKGQASPTSEPEFDSGTSPGGSHLEPYHPLTSAIALDCGFVARGFVGEREHLSVLIRRGIGHRGFALIDILQPCVSFNKVNTFKWYKERVYDLGDTDYDPADRMAAFEKSREWGKRIPIGVIYESERATFDSREVALQATPLARREWKPERLLKIMEELK